MFRCYDFATDVLRTDCDKLREISQVADNSGTVTTETDDKPKDESDHQKETVDVDVPDSGPQINEAAEEEQQTVSETVPPQTDSDAAPSSSSEGNSRTSVHGPDVCGNELVKVLPPSVVTGANTFIDMDAQRDDLIEFVMLQIPALVDMYLRQTVNNSTAELSVAQQVEQFERMKSVEQNKAEEAPIELQPAVIELHTPINDVEVSGMADKDDSEVADKSVEQQEDVDLQAAEHQISFLFHENVGGELVTIPGTELHKMWFVLNSGETVWPSNASVILENLIGVFHVRKSSVPPLGPGEVGAISVSLTVPAKSGVYNINFALKSDESNVFVTCGDLTCSVTVLEDALGYANSRMASSCITTSLNTSENGNDEANVTVVANKENFKSEKAALGAEAETEDEVTSLCDDETVMDENLDYNTDEDPDSSLEDFTMIPLPDCFDLNRVPALQSSFVQLKASEYSSAKGDLMPPLGDPNVDEEYHVASDDEYKVEPDLSHSDVKSFDTALFITSVEQSQEEELGKEKSVEDKDAGGDTDCEVDVDEDPEMTSIEAEEDKGEPEETKGDAIVSQPQNVVTPSEEKSLLDRLTKLGFGDREGNRLLLIKHGYNLQLVVKELINNFEPLR